LHKRIYIFIFVAVIEKVSPLKIALMDNKYFTNRKSIRQFSTQEVADELIQEIVDLAIKAPTTGNMQLYSVIATREESNRRELAKLHFNQPAAANAPVLLTVCADVYRFERWCENSNAKLGFGNLQGMLYAFFDAVIFAQQIVTIAEMKGLGTCYLGTAVFNAPQIADMLKLPAKTVPVVCLAIGYPAESGTDTERLSGKDILSFEQYPTLSDEQIKEVYLVKDEYPANKEYVLQNGKENIAQVFTDVRYPEGMNTEFSKVLSDFLRKQGFDI
jgi:nitroreductase